MLPLRGRPTGYEVSGRQRLAQILLGLAAVAVLVLAVVGVITWIRDGASSPVTAEPTSTPAPTSMPGPGPTVEPTSAPPSGPTAGPTVQPTAPPPTVPPTPPPTNTPPPTPTDTPVPPSPTPQSDAQGDVETYADGQPVSPAPVGIDIRTSNVGEGLNRVLQPGAAPAELAGTLAEGEVMVWMVLYEPIPDPPVWYTEWVFGMDLDGDPSTGRPPGSARIDPDLGMEVAAGAFYDAINERYDTYLLVWDPAQQMVVRREDKPRLVLDDSRTVLGLALPLETLTGATTGGTIAEGARGRAAALSWWVDDQKVIDYSPDRPVE